MATHRKRSHKRKHTRRLRHRSRRQRGGIYGALAAGVAAAAPTPYRPTTQPTPGVVAKPTKKARVQAPLQATIRKTGLFGKTSGCRWELMGISNEDHIEYKKHFAEMQDEIMNKFDDHPFGYYYGVKLLNLPLKLYGGVVNMSLHEHQPYKTYLPMITERIISPQELTNEQKYKLCLLDEMYGISSESPPAIDFQDLIRFLWFLFNAKHININGDIHTGMYKMFQTQIPILVGKYSNVRFFNDELGIRDPYIDEYTQILPKITGSLKNYNPPAPLSAKATFEKYFGPLNMGVNV